jgi:hypothetical protein
VDLYIHSPIRLHSTGTTLPFYTLIFTLLLRCAITRCVTRSMYTFLPCQLKRYRYEILLKTFPAQLPASRCIAAQRPYKRGLPHSHFRRNTTTPHDRYQSNQILSVCRAVWKRAQVSLIGVESPDMIFVSAVTAICRIQKSVVSLVQVPYHQNIWECDGKIPRNFKFLTNYETNY